MTDIPYGRQLTDLADNDPDGTALIFIARDGAQTSLSWCQLEQAANTWGRALRSKGVAFGDHIALCLPNSVELVNTVLAAWKIGAIPIPMRWDLPDWEQQRLLEVIDPAFVLDGSTAGDLQRAAATHSDAPLPVVVSPP